MDKRKTYMASSCIFGVLGILVICYVIILSFNQYVTLSLAGRILLALLACVFAYCGCFSLLHVYPHKKEEIRKGLLIICLGVYLGLLAIMLLFYNQFGRGLRCIFMVHAEERTVYIKHCLNLMPGKTLISYLKGNASMSYTVINLLGNLVMLTPFAIFLPYLLPVIKKTAFYFMAVFAISIVIECFQLLLMCGSADVDDVILNSLGSVLFYFAVNHTKLRRVIQHILWIE